MIWYALGYHLGKKLGACCGEDEREPGSGRIFGRNV